MQAPAASRTTGAPATATSNCLPLQLECTQPISSLRSLPAQVAGVLHPCPSPNTAAGSGASLPIHALMSLEGTNKERAIYGQPLGHTDRSITDVVLRFTLLGLTRLAPDTRGGW